MQLNRLLAGLSLASVAVLSLPSTGISWPFIYSEWQGLYPASQTDDNIINGGGSGCQVCHEQPNGGQPWNPYGWRVRTEILATGDIVMGLQAAEPFDSDMDPTGSSNVDEINASTQPGWTVGANNTLYFDNGTTTPGQTAPSQVQGPLDPPGTLGTNYCGPAVMNSSGQSATISATGSDVAAANDFTLHADSLPSNQFGYFLASQNQGFFSPPASVGFVCLGANIGRYAGNVLNSGAGGSYSLQIDLTSIPVNPIQSVMPGESWNFQSWFRDVGNTNNFTDGLNVVFQ